MNTAIDISRAEDIFGYMSTQELLWLAEQASTRHRIVEIGCYNGRSTRALADHTPGVVWAIDKWAAMDYTPQLHMNPKEAFELYLGDHIDTGKVRMLQMDHSMIHPFMLDHLRNLDLAFIDGGHEHNEVVRDIIEWRGRLAPGGLLCGHDAHDANWPGVDQAVAELIPDVQYVPNTAIWWVNV